MGACGPTRGCRGDEQAAELLQQTLEEEAETDKKLTELAESTINLQAAQTGN